MQRKNINKQYPRCRGCKCVKVLYFFVFAIVAIVWLFVHSYCIYSQISQSRFQQNLRKKLVTLAKCSWSHALLKFISVVQYSSSLLALRLPFFFHMRIYFLLDFSTSAAAAWWQERRRMRRLHAPSPYRDAKICRDLIADYYTFLCFACDSDPTYTVWSKGHSLCLCVCVWDCTQASRMTWHATLFYPWKVRFRGLL